MPRAWTQPGLPSVGRRVSSLVGMHWPWPKPAAKIRGPKGSRLRVDRHSGPAHVFPSCFPPGVARGPLFCPSAPQCPLGVSASFILAFPTTPSCLRPRPFSAIQPGSTHSNWVRLLCE
jgi:hypothetical protein